MAKRGRPVGSKSKTLTCSSCGEQGHTTANGGESCSAVALAERLVLDQGWSQADAARHVGVTRQAVGERLRNLAKRAATNAAHNEAWWEARTGSAEGTGVAK